MASGIGGIIARSVPPPGKLGRGAPPAHAEPDADEEGGPSDYDADDEDKAAETAAADRVAQALGIKGVDTDELREALKDFSATIKE